MERKKEREKKNIYGVVKPHIGRASKKTLALYLSNISLIMDTSCHGHANQQLIFLLKELQGIQWYNS